MASGKDPDPCVELPPNVGSSEDESLPPDVESDTESDPDMPILTETDAEDNVPELPPGTDLPCRCAKKCYQKFPMEYLLKLRSEIQDLPFVDRQRKQFDKVRLHLVDNNGKRHSKGRKVHKHN